MNPPDSTALFNAKTKYYYWRKAKLVIVSAPIAFRKCNDLMILNREKGRRGTPPSPFNQPF